MIDAATFIPLVWSIAHKVKRRVPWNTIDINDLAAAGAIGLMSALKRYRPRGGCKPSSYLGIRIHGAMLDHLRDMDHLSVTARSELRRRQKVGEPAGPMALHDLPPRGFVFEDEAVADRRPPASTLELEELLGWIRRKTSPRTALIMKLRFVDGRTHDEIAESLGVSTSFVNQTAAKAIIKLRATYVA